ncbi:MAG: flippase-like domain-containing protein [Chloroflexi bacterium]|nr:flippase-like domain-containing protein [Chloroflexota bacterium]
MTRNQRLLVIVGMVISAIFLWIAFRNLNPEAVWEHLREINPLWLLLAVAVWFLALTLIALRWQYLLRSIKPVRLHHLLPLTAIGYMGNNVYPFRSGEVLRLLLLQRDHGIPFAKAATVVVIERVFDGLVMLTFIILPLLFIELSSPIVRQVALITAPLFLALLALFFVLAARPNILRRVVTFFCRFLPGRLRDLALRLSEDVLHGLEGLRTPADLAGAVVSSYTSWMVEAATYWLVSLAFNLGVSYAEILLVVGVVNLAGLIPATPGQIGVYEYAVTTVLAGLGVAQAPALAYALVVHIVIWLPVTLVGFFLLARRGLGWRAISHARELEHAASSS